MWVAARSDDRGVDAQLAGDIAHDVGESLDQPEANRARGDDQVNRPFRQLSIEHRERNRAGRVHPHTRGLIQPEIDVEHLAGVVDAPNEALIRKALNPSLRDRDARLHDRFLRRPADRRIEIDNAAVGGGPLERAFERVEKHVRRRHTQSALSVRSPRA